MGAEERAERVTCRDLKDGGADVTLSGRAERQDKQSDGGGKWQSRVKRGGKQKDAPVSSRKKEEQLRKEKGNVRQSYQGVYYTHTHTHGALCRLKQSGGSYHSKMGLTPSEHVDTHPSPAVGLAPPGERAVCHPASPRLAAQHTACYPVRHGHSVSSVGVH